MQRIERYGVIALVFLLVTILAVSLWGEGKDKARGILASVRGGAEEAVAPARHSGADAAPVGAVRGPVAAAKAPLSTPVDPAAIKPHKRGRGKNPDVRTATPSALPTPRAAASQPRPQPAPVGNAAATAVATRTEPALTPVLRPESQPADFRRPPAGRVYVVRPGDTLSVIAQRELGTCKRWPEIAALNGDLDPAKLRQGMRLRMPEGSGAARVLVAEATTPSREKAVAPAPAPRPAAGATYTVKSGDVLGVIAQRELGSSKRWPEIVELNPGIDPDRLIVGARLSMPGAGARVHEVAVADTRSAYSASTPSRSTQSNPTKARVR